MTDGKGAGDTLQLGDSVYRITDMETWCLENGENVYLEYVSGEDTGYYGLVRSYSDNYYTPLLKDDVIDVVTLYTGSLYFSKDCIITVNDPGNAFRDHVVAIEDYFYSDAVGSQFGWFSGGLVLWGEFECDSSGLIISYTEEFLS